MEPPSLILIHGDVLIDRRALAEGLPGAWAAILVERGGGSAEAWRAATAQVAADWDSYWEDLDLSGDDSLQQWREGRWRIVRAWFRLAGQPLPSNERIAHYLDELPHEVGCHLSAWRGGAVEALRSLAEAGIAAILVEPYTPESLVRGMLDAAGLSNPVIGPGTLEQIGLEGLDCSALAGRLGSEPGRCRFVSAKPLPGLPTLTPPGDLSRLAEVIREEGHDSA